MTKIVAGDCMSMQWARRVSAIASVAFAGAWLCLLAGCANPRYEFARTKTPERALNAPFPPGPLEATLATQISFGGPGSWKYKAYWDEYVVTLRNPGDQPLNVTFAALVDSRGTVHAAGDDPWALEKESRILQNKGSGAGEAIVRNVVPGALILGAGIAAIAANPLASGANTAAVGTLVGLPLYYLVVWAINSSNRDAIEAEFTRRRLALPLSLAPHGSRTGSLFFPMVSDPRALNLKWSSEPDRGESVLPLDFLHALPVPAPTTDGPTHKTSSP
jgi:hypothetical protein